VRNRHVENKKKNQKQIPYFFLIFRANVRVAKNFFGSRATVGGDPRTKRDGLGCVAIHPAASSLPRDGARCLLRRIWILCMNKDRSTLLCVPHLASNPLSWLIREYALLWRSRLHLKICMRKHGDLRVCERAEFDSCCWPRRIFYSTSHHVLAHLEKRKDASRVRALEFFF